MDFNNPAHLKIALLSEGTRIDDKATDGIGTKYLEKIYSYSLTDWICEKRLFPSDILMDNVYTGFRFNPSSPWNITKVRKNLHLEYDTQIIRQIDFAKRPKYYKLSIASNKPLSSIAKSCGNHALSIFVNTFCEYFKNDENCRFCSLVPTQKIFSDTVKMKKVQEVSEAVGKILDLETPLSFIQLSGGSFYDHNHEVELYRPFIRVIHHELKERLLDHIIPVHLTCMPPQNYSILEELISDGLDTISFDLELPTEHFFNKYCPGKAKTTGYQGMRKALRTTLNIFGEGKVYSILIAGIEPVDSFVTGVENLLSDGIITTLNVYHNDPLSAPKMDVGNPNPEELINMMNEIGKLFRKYAVKAGELGCAHYDLGHEIRKGYF